MSEAARLLHAAVGRLGGQRREGQEAMAEAVARALEDGRPLVVQAGTGTGKSLGYLVPAVARAVREGERVVVATATLALQRQVFQSDLPLVVEALADELGGRPGIALLKGRNNYLCRHRMAGGYPEPEDALPIGPTSPLGRDVARLHEWAGQTTTGDRDDLVPGVSGRAWAQVSVSARECLGQKCPLVGECFSEQAREEARTAQIVVTNHAMLAVEATSHEVLGPHSALIVDEAHELAARVTSGATVELTAHRVEAAARAMRRCNLDSVALDEAGKALDRALDQARPARLPHGVGDDLALPLAAVRDAARAGITAVKGLGDDGGAPAKVAQAALGEVFDVCEALIAGRIDPAAGIAHEEPGGAYESGGAPESGDGHERPVTSPLVVWLAPPDGEYDAPRPSRVVAAPLDVSGLIRARLVGDRAAVFTSATLALGGSFAGMSAQWGLQDPAVLDAGSPFDYRKQGILYVASHLERPGPGGIAEDALDELAALIEAAGGRTLGLFSSHRAAQTATDAMRERLDLPILNQLDDQVSTQVGRFREDERACLLGSTTLWQGIDLPGPTCQLVVIDRLPFPRPDDPVAQARAEAVDVRGGNGFMAVSASHAALLLAQGAGRLIRSLGDRGVVAVLDSRLATARYGSFLTRSLPPLWPTTDRAVVLEALRRLDAAAPASTTASEDEEVIPAAAP